MIKIASGFTGPGGSTVVFDTLVNLFNDNGMMACLYGPQEWDGISCDFRPLSSLEVTGDDYLIYHFMSLPSRPHAKKVILSCHETEIFEIRKFATRYDRIHFVSEYQRRWQNLTGTVIPNPIRKFDKVEKTERVAGIIGSIDKNKRVHVSIQRALEDGFEDIRLYGAVTDINYFKQEVEPMLSDKVTLRGISIDMNETYKGLSHVYHSPQQETFNLIKPECLAAGVNYAGNEGNDTQAEYWDNERIISAWKKLLSY